MKNFESIKIGDKLFMMQQQVVVINIYPCFHLAKVSEVNHNKLFYTDISALSKKPKFEVSISIHNMRRVGFG